MNRQQALQLTFASLALASVCLLLRYELAQASESVGLGFLFYFFSERWAVAVFALAAFYGAYRLALLRNSN